MVRPSGCVYILTGLKSAQFECMEELRLLRRQSREGPLGTGLASQSGSFTPMCMIVVGDFLDPYQVLQHSPLRDLNPGRDHLAMQKRQQCQCEDTVESVNADHQIGPMKGRREADEAWILHVTERPLDMMLAAVAEDDLVVREFGISREEHPLAEDAALELLVGNLVCGEFNRQPAVPFHHAGREEIADVLPRRLRLELLFETLACEGLAAPACLMAPFDAPLEIAEGSDLFHEVLTYPPHLAAEQGLAAGNENGALLPEDFLLCAKDAQPLEKRSFQGQYKLAHSPPLRYDLGNRGQML